MPAAKCYFDTPLHHLSVDTSPALPSPHHLPPQSNTILRSKAYGLNTGSLSLSLRLLLHPLNSASPLLHLSQGAGILHGVVFEPLTSPHGPPVVLGFHFAPNLRNVCAGFSIVSPVGHGLPGLVGPSHPSRQ